MAAADSSLVQHADAILRSEGQHSIGTSRTPWVSLVLLTTLSGSIYGLVMGAYNLRALQMLYAALKVPLLLAVADACLPSQFLRHQLGARPPRPAPCVALRHPRGPGHPRPYHPVACPRHCFHLPVDVQL